MQIIREMKGKILSIGYSGFIKITDKEKYIEMWKQINSESKAALQDEEYLYQAFRYELSNHEFSYTYDYEDTLDYFNLKYEDLTQKQLSILERAKTDYLKGCEGY